MHIGAVIIVRLVAPTMLLIIIKANVVQVFFSFFIYAHRLVLRGT